MIKKGFIFSIILILFIGSCQKIKFEKLQFRGDYESPKTFLCDLWDNAFYVLHCFTFDLREPPSGYIHNLNYEIEEIALSDALPSSANNNIATIKAKASGEFKGQIWKLISPLLVLSPPPACAVVDPSIEVKVGTIVIDWELSGEISYTWGSTIIIHDQNCNNILITKSRYTFSEFDIRNIPDYVDDAILSLFKKSIKRSLDQALHDKLVLTISCVGSEGRTMPTTDETGHRIEVYQSNADSDRDGLCD